MTGAEEEALAALRLADWLESVRAASGYGGPIAHWWRDCLLDCRPGYDWRYEGIIAGYLSLHEVTGDERWLERARAAGDDLVGAQTVDGHFRQSRFELNPGSRGTPHEAAASTGLLRLALALAARGEGASYLDAARRNLEHAHVGRLWDAAARAFRDDPTTPSFVPNKASTIVEALALLADATGQDRHVLEHALPTAEMVLRHQVRRPGSWLDGAIAQNSFGWTPIPRYFPYYVARCVPGLLAAHRFAGDDRFAEAALAAGRFLLRCRDEDGGFPQVVYEAGWVNRFPRWVAATGDVARALELLRPLGLAADTEPTRRWLIGGQLGTGGMMTARGFAAQGTGRAPPELPEFRDLLSVAGWVDKAFRYLASRLSRAAVGAAAAALRPPGVVDADCVFGGRRLRLQADQHGLTLRERGRAVYRWRAGEDWADVTAPWVAVS